jgi:uncharacterized protein YndB with AHSA1/START domain
VFDAWLDPAEAAHFLFATAEGEIIRCDIDPRAGGTFRIVDRRPQGDAEHHGKYLEVDRPRRLAFLFRGPGTNEDEWSKVTVDIGPHDRVSAITLTHEIPSEWASYAEPVRCGWTMIFDTLALHMETKHD